jgi:ribosomal protein S9
MEVINAIGRRKSAVARVYLTEGTGKITINKKDIEKYFPSAILRYVVKQPLQLLEPLRNTTSRPTSTVVASLARARLSASPSLAHW